MNSCLYDCAIMHYRVKPKKHKLEHKIFMFYLDLDEIDEVARKVPLISRNRFNFYNFCDNDHLVFGARTAKENLREYLKTKGVSLNGGRVMLLTNLRTLGHVFNPVSFYFCFDVSGNPTCVVPEIGNTFGELKPYFLDRETFQNGKFFDRQKKYYYISPFTDLDITMEFQLKVPDDRLEIRVDDLQDGDKFLYASMTGERKELTNANLLWRSLCFPFVTLKVIGLIHFHAMLLYLKGMRHHKKEENPDLQKEVLRVWNKH